MIYSSTDKWVGQGNVQFLAMKMKTLTAIVSRNLTSMWEDGWKLVVILYYINGIHIKCTEVTTFITRILHQKIFIKIYI
jgi:hypothetical protein